MPTGLPDLPAEQHRCLRLAFALARHPRLPFALLDDPLAPFTHSTGFGVSIASRSVPATSPASYQVGTAYGHIAITSDDLDATLARLAAQGTSPEKPPYSVREGGSRLCFVKDPDRSVPLCN
jgi:catechol 2,3-dioxygenase-like lactoylglutathione lyase family enzyme